MTINPKLKIVSGAALVAGGIYEIRNAIKEADKKKKIIHGLIGAGLCIGGIWYGRKGVIQVIGLNEQAKKTDAANDPAKAIATDLKEKAEEEKPVKSQNFSGQKKNIIPSRDSFDQIMNSSGGNTTRMDTRSPVEQAVSEVMANRNNNGATRPAAPIIDAKKIAESRRIKQEIKNDITVKELELKRTIKDKSLGWNSDKAKQLRYDIAIQKARLFHI